MKTIGRPTRGALAITLSALVLASCGSSTLSGTPSAEPSASVPASASALPSGEPASAPRSTPPSPGPTATLTPTAKPASLVVNWHRSADIAAPNDSWWSWASGQQGQIWTKFGDLYLLAVGTEGYDGASGGPQIWVSSDVLHWHRASVAHSATEQATVRALTLGGPGLVATGYDTSGDTPVALTWTSMDGETWTRIANTDTGLTLGQRWLLDAVAEGHARFVAGPVDVTEFLGPPFDSVNSVRVIVSQGGATAFVSKPDAKKPVEIWQAIGSNGWKKVGTLPRSTGATVLDAVQGPHGTFLMGCGPDCSGIVGWASANGATWLSSNVSSFDNVGVILADESGFIAVGERVTGTGCAAVAESEIFGESWTSTDGRTWHKMKDEAQFDHTSIHVLIPNGRTLVGLGTWWSADHAVSTAWTTTLPNDSVVGGPASTPAPGSGPGGCGP